MLTRTSLKELDRLVQKFYERTLRSKCEDRRIPVAVDPNLSNDIYEPNGIYYPVRTLTEKILLGVLQWYMPRELGVLTNLWLDEHWGAEFKEIKVVLNSSKDTALGYLLVSDRWNERDFFGNVLCERQMRNICRLSFRKRKTSRPKRLVRRRGYNDKGTLRLPHRSLGYDYRKLKTVEQILQEEVELQQRIDQLSDLIFDRLEQESA